MRFDSFTGRLIQDDGPTFYLADLPTGNGVPLRTVGPNGDEDDDDLPEDEDDEDNDDILDDEDDD